MLFRRFIQKVAKEIKEEFPQETKVRFEVRTFTWKDEANDKWEICVDYKGNRDDNTSKIEFEVEI